MKLVNSAISQLFTIPQTTWTEINQRVGFVLHVGNINSNAGDFKVPWPSEENWNNLQNICNDSDLLLGVSSHNVNNVPINGTVYIDSCWCIGTHSPNVLNDCKSWASTDFHNLVSLASNVATYANNAVASFQGILNSLQASNNTVTPAIAACTKTALQTLNTSTVSLSNNMQAALTKLKGFLASHQQFNQFFITNSFLVPMINVPQLQPTAFNHFDSALEGVLGAWNALSGDIASMDSTTVNVDLAFLMSLDINAAITDWKNIANEANSFAQSAAGQEKCWQH